MKTIVLVCLFFFFGEDRTTLNISEIKEIEVRKEMKSMEECEYYKHQLEMMAPPPPAFAQGFYCLEEVAI